MMLWLPLVAAQGETGLLTWVLEGGGYISEMQEIRTENGLRGIYAKSPIPKDTLLTQIPWSHLIAHSDMCETIEMIRKELTNSSSFYKPYFESLVEYHPRIPYSWDSLAGLEQLPPYDWRRHSAWFRSACQREPDRALELYLGRSAGHVNGFLFCPIYDGYNHQNPPNTFIRIEWDNVFQVFTARDIQRGEQLFNSYGQGTPEIYRDYGFIEFPQRWDINGISFDVDDRIIWREVPSLADFDSKVKHVMEELQKDDDDLARPYREALRSALHKARLDLLQNEEL